MDFLRRIKRLALLLFCMIRGEVFGPANRVPKNISRIIVVPTGKLGDVVCCTPVLFALRKNLPNAQIIVAGNSKLHSALLADSGLADEYLDLRPKFPINRIRRTKADVAIITGPSFDVAAPLYLAGIPLVVAPKVVGGFSPNETRPYKVLQRYLRLYPYGFGKYAPRERLHSLEPIGITTDDTTKHLGFSKEAADMSLKLISGLPPHKYLVGISAGAGNKEKLWSPAKFGEVANYLIDAYDAHIIVIGGKNDSAESAEMMRGIKRQEKVTDTTYTNIDELKAITSKLDIFISVNSGPIYVAEAFDIPTVDLIGPVSAWDQPPQGKIHKMVFAPGNPEPLAFVLNARMHDVREAMRIAESTRVEDVIKAAEEALREADMKKAK